MRESKYELTNWKKWKYKINLLKETKEELKDMKKAIPIGSDNMPGGSHTSVIDKMQRIIDECDRYDDVINNYQFIVNRLERAIATLSIEERKVCIIIANNPYNYKTREMEALEKGFSRATFYRILDDVYSKLDDMLLIKTEMTVNDYDREIY